MNAWEWVRRHMCEHACLAPNKADAHAAPQFNVHGVQLGVESSHSRSEMQSANPVQARYRSRQKNKQAEQDKRLQEVEEAKKALQAEMTAFNAQKQAWRAIMHSCQQPQLDNLLHPERAAVQLRGEDTYEVSTMAVYSHACMACNSIQ